MHSKTTEHNFLFSLIQVPYFKKLENLQADEQVCARELATELNSKVHVTLLKQTGDD